MVKESTIYFSIGRLNQRIKRADEDIAAIERTPIDRRKTHHGFESEKQKQQQLSNVRGFRAGLVEAKAVIEAILEDV